MSKLKVEGHENLVRDKNNNAIINTDKSSYESYMKKVVTRRAEKETRTNFRNYRGFRLNF